MKSEKTKKILIAIVSAFVGFPMGRVDETEQLYAEANSEFADRRSFPWLTANTMGYPDQGMDSLHQFDADRNLNALAGFLLHGTFDPRPFPNLIAHLEVHGNETGHVGEVPYSCFRNADP
jgi:hypothetical protein